MTVLYLTFYYKLALKRKLLVFLCDMKRGYKVLCCIKDSFYLSVDVDLVLLIFCHGNGVVVEAS